MWSRRATCITIAVVTLFSLCENALFSSQALAMIHRIREAFTELLDEVSWMDDQTRIVAQEKVSANSV